LSPLFGNKEWTADIPFVVLIPNLVGRCVPFLSMEAPREWHDIENMKEPEAHAASHTFEDMKQWWDHESRALGPMIAGGRLSVPALKAYEKKLEKLAALTSLVKTHYTHRDTQREIGLLVERIHHLHHYVRDVMLPHATFKEEEEKRVMAPVNARAVQARARGGTRDTAGRYK
jgi:hypothetical protein